ncbi:MAG: hypothetical protein ACP5OE_09670 [Thermodesulfobium sp.]
MDLSEVKHAYFQLKESVDRVKCSHGWQEKKLILGGRFTQQAVAYLKELNNKKREQIEHKNLDSNDDEYSDIRIIVNKLDV